MDRLTTVLAFVGGMAVLWLFNRAWIARPFTRLMNAPLFGHPTEHWAGLGVLAFIVIGAIVQLTVAFTTGHFLQ